MSIAAFTAFAGMRYVQIQYDRSYVILIFLFSTGESTTQKSKVCEQLKNRLDEADDDDLAQILNFIGLGGSNTDAEEEEEEDYYISSLIS